MSQAKEKGNAGGPGNVLLITTDEQRADAMGCYGNPDVLTSLRDDPREMRNLAGDAAVRETERGLADDLLAWLLKTPGHRLPRLEVW